MPTTDIVLLLVLLHLLVAPASAQRVALPGCRDKCGNITVPYPFGIGAGCFRDGGRLGFQLECDDSGPDSSPPRLTVRGYSHRLSALSVDAGEAHAYLNATRECYNSTGGVVERNNKSYMSLVGSAYVFSSTGNRLVALGCPSVGFFIDAAGDYVSGCMSVCRRPSQYTMPGPWTGVGCCQSAIPSGIDYFNPYQGKFPLVPNDNLPSISNSTSCHYVFLVDADWFSYSDRVFLKRTDDFAVPVVLDWALRHIDNCSAARHNATDFACRSTHSECLDASNGPGYRCSCSKGYGGNPYLDGGCQDIDECLDKNICDGTCHNTIGNFICCPQKTKYDPKKMQCTPSKQKNIIIGVIIGLGATLGMLLVGLSGVFFFNRWKRGIRKQQRRMYFRKNQGLLLEQLILSDENASDRTMIFSLEELVKATNNFDDTRIVGRGGHGMVYKDILSDQRVVAIKKSKLVEETEIKEFINEVAILSQINHRNIVKLFGCCLETEVPLLVSDFIPNGSLFDVLHGESVSGFLLSWDDCLRIALEAAGPLCYLHTSSSISVFHRDVKSSNILLDGYYTSKVSDFGASRTAPIHQTHVTTNVQGTFGYLDPEYYQTGKLHEKSDVYSFGVLLLELLTRKEPVFRSNADGEYYQNLSIYFISEIKLRPVREVVATQVLEEASEHEINTIASLAEMCLRLRGEEGPTMKQVESTLQYLRTKRLTSCQISEGSDEEIRSFVTSCQPPTVPTYQPL